MANNALDVLVGATGKVYGAVAGTALPNTPTASLNAAFKDMGYISENGAVLKIGQTSADIKDWSGSVVRTVQTEQNVEITTTMIETNANSVGAFFGSANVTAGVVTITSSVNTRGAWVIDVVDGASLVRLVVPDGEIVVHDDITFKAGEPVAYGVTIKCYADSTGTKVYEYLTTPGVS